MIRNVATVDAGTVIERDVCIVGAGAAGISLALELDRRGFSVCLLEGGGGGHEDSSQDLYRGAEPEGDLIGTADYLRDSRQRFLGGTTNHWGGYCAPLDPIDFARRAWIPHSGWPFGRETVEPWYHRAAELLEIRPFDYGPGQLTHAPLPLDTDGLETALYHLSPPTRFGTRYRPQLAAAERILLLLHANATAVLTDTTGTAATGVEVADLAAKHFQVRARNTVLAAGALENARLLLVSNQVLPAGLGNGHDLVGRYFMDHFYGTRVAQVAFLYPARDLALYAQEAPDPRIGTTVHGVLRFSDALQREHQLFNVQFRLLPVAARPKGFLADLTDLAEQWDPQAQPRSPAARSVALVEVGTEIAPEPGNRVTLSAHRDALGLPRLQLHVATSAFDREALDRAVRTLAETLGASLAARARVILDPHAPFSSLLPGSHHMGTTRMHDDPRRGVVDANCRVHGVANLHVAGSSVFPTSGRANPTYTLVALALRLADHLANGAKT